MSCEGLLGVDSGKSVICCPWAGHAGPSGGHEAHRWWLAQSSKVPGNGCCCRGPGVLRDGPVPCLPPPPACLTHTCLPSATVFPVSGRGWSLGLWIRERCPLLDLHAGSSCFSRVRLFANPWTVACQAPLSMGFSSQEYWSGCRDLLQGIFPTQGLNPHLLHCRQILYT